MDDVVYRDSKGVADAEPLARAHALRREADGVLGGLSFEAFPSTEALARELMDSDPHDWVVAEVGGEVTAYGHALHDWSEHDGRRCYLHLGWVAPEHRGNGIGTGLLARLEARCHEKAVRDGALGRADLGANASRTETSAQGLLLDAGYAVLYTAMEMERPLGLPVELSPMPDGYNLHPLLPEYRRQVWQMIGDAYFDPSESGRGGEVGTEEGYRAYFEGEGADPSLAFVAWRGSRVAGVVLSRISNGVAQVVEASVGHAHRRRGLARALLTRSLVEMEGRSPRAVRIVTKKEFPTQAWRLYESVGYRTVKEFPRWRKKMGA